MVETKTCSRCGVEKPRGEFYAKAGRCKVCCREQQRGRKENPSSPHRIAARRERIRRWNLENKDKKRAHKQVEIAVANGSLAKPETCSRCRQPGRIEAHHHDYSKPLEVEWVCSNCHRHEHFSPELAALDKQKAAAFGEDR